MRPRAESDFSRMAGALESNGATLERGLSQLELDAVSKAFGFRFPPDLEGLLRAFLPRGDRFPNWRDLDDPRLRASLDWPAEGVAFDVEHDAYWNDDWEARPCDISEAIEIARRRVAEAPTLIPIYAHRYLPAEPCLAGNPVFSVYQTDIIVYGVDLADYFENEFGGADRSRTSMHPTRSIRFWSVLVG